MKRSIWERSQANAKLGLPVPDASPCNRAHAELAVCTAEPCSITGLELQPLSRELDYIGGNLEIVTYDRCKRARRMRLLRSKAAVGKQALIAHAHSIAESRRAESDQGEKRFSEEVVAASLV